MNITFDITERFRAVIDTEELFERTEEPLNPIIFLDMRERLPETYEFELMNFGLYVDDNMEEEFARKSPYFDDYINLSVPYKHILIHGKAKIKITEVKGADLRLTDTDPRFVTAEQFLYYTWDYKLKKGDRVFECEANSSFSPYFASIKIIAGKDSQATITFNSSDYTVVDLDLWEMQQAVAKKQTKFQYLSDETSERILNKCTEIKGRMFDHKFWRKLTKARRENGYFVTPTAKWSEWYFELPRYKRVESKYVRKP